MLWSVSQALKICGQICIDGMGIGVNKTARVEAEYWIDKVRRWENKLEEFKPCLDSALPYKDICVALSKIKVDLKAEVVFARSKVRENPDSLEALYYLRIMDVAHLLNARVDSKPYLKLRENIDCVEQVIREIVGEIETRLEDGNSRKR